MANKKLSSFNELSSIVYSTDPDFVYEQANEDVETLEPEKQKLHILLDKKGRKGKQVTLITGFIGNKKDLEVLAKTLKTKCSCGGSIEDSTILIQGDKREQIHQILSSLNYKVK